MIKVSVSIDVSNLQEGEKFYIEGLGCKKIKDQGGMSVLSTENCDIYLQEKKLGTNPIELSSEKTVRDYKRHWTPIHLDFITPNIDELTKKVTEFGGICEGGDSWDGGSISYCVDPFGNGFCIINE